MTVLHSINTPTTAGKKVKATKETRMSTTKALMYSHDSLWYCCLKKSWLTPWLLLVNSESIPLGVCSPPDLPDFREVPGHCLSLQQSAPRQTSDRGQSFHFSAWISEYQNICMCGVLFFVFISNCSTSYLAAHYLASVEVQWNVFFSGIWNDFIFIVLDI